MSSILKGMKYTIKSRGQVLYRRRYPRRLKAHPLVKGEFFTRSLGVKTTDPDDKKLKAWQQVNEDFEKFTESLAMADGEALEAAESLRYAEAMLRSKRLEPGYLAPSPLLSDDQNDAIGQERWIEVLESEVLPSSTVKDVSI